MKDEVKTVLDKYHYESINEEEEKAKKENLLRIQDVTGQVYTVENIQEICHNLKMLDNDWSKQQLKLLGKGCPLSLR